ncbi:MAG: MDR family oxidoreductase [Bacteroidota bacterium]
MPRALFVDRDADRTLATVRTLDPEALPEGDVLVEGLYSSLNYKDGLAVTGRGKIIRGALPFVPGIDLVGRVLSSTAEAYAPGDLVIQTGWHLGEARWGGFSQQQRVEARSLVPLPPGLSPLHAMVAGTAGFTAMLSVMTLEEHGLTPDQGTVVVTGASGGVGSFSVALLHERGFHVAASTGSEGAHAYLRSLGADDIQPRDVLGAGAQRPLDKAQYAGAIDCVGGDTLAALLSTMGRHGCVAACGLAGGAALHTTVFPFILRGVVLAGIDSNTCPPARRRAAWASLAALPASLYDAIHTDTIALDEVPARSDALLAGHIQGRLVVDLQQ